MYIDAIATILFGWEGGGQFKMQVFFKFLASSVLIIRDILQKETWHGNKEV